MNTGPAKPFVFTRGSGHLSTASQGGNPLGRSIMRHRHAMLICIFAVAGLLRPPVAALADDNSDLKEQLRLLQQQNQLLQQQLEKQQTVIESLTKKVNEIQDTGSQSRRDIERLENEMTSSGSSSSSGLSSALSKVAISGEAGFAFFHSGSEGQYPNSQFKVDEARIFLDAPVWNHVYFYSELQLAYREGQDLDSYLGECYVDAENISDAWGQDALLNARIGRLYTPFGEEYLNRFAIDNPLISHSLSDIWGLDEGLELYGKLGKFCYVGAVQNGGIQDVHDYDRDKSIAGHISYEPVPWLHASVSGMRTGNLDVGGDQMSALWFGGGFFRSIGTAQTTKFHAQLVEGDLDFRIPRGHVNVFGGYARYADNDPARDNGRDIYYYSIEAVHDVVGKLYAGARFSQIFAEHGYPLVGNGGFGQYFYGPWSDQLWRLSLGLGYRFSDNLVVKTEYSFEQGREANGGLRNQENLFAFEVAVKF